MKTNITALFTTIVSSIPKLSLTSLLLLGFPGICLAQVKNVEITATETSNANEKVTVRVKATQDGDRPALDLTEDNFRLTVDGEPLEFNPNDWKSPEESVPPPAWIVVLLDMSGSMNAPDSTGVSRLQGAIQAVREFNNQAAKRGGNTQVAIVPFGEPGANCQGYPINDSTIDSFFPAGDFKLDNYLDFLANSSPCASTNLYEPLGQTIRFLTNGEDPRFAVPENTNDPQPRLAVILLSDGYHNAPNEQADFDRLLKQLQRADGVTVHTLGYGLTATQLGQKYKLGRPATKGDINAGKVPEDEFVDEARLAEIAKSTGGISEFSGRADDIANSLNLFLNSLLGEYEISYIQPNAERGSRHTVQVEVVDSPNAEPVSSQTEEYIMPAFGRSVPLSVRLWMLVITIIILGLGGILPFYFWGQHLKQEAMDS